MLRMIKFTVADAKVAYPLIQLLLGRMEVEPHELVEILRLVAAGQEIPQQLQSAWSQLETKAHADEANDGIAMSIGSDGDWSLSVDGKYGIVFEGDQFDHPAFVTLFLSTILAIDPLAMLDDSVFYYESRRVDTPSISGRIEVEMKGPDLVIHALARHVLAVARDLAQQASVAKEFEQAHGWPLQPLHTF